MYALRTRAPLVSIRRPVTVRLACIKPAASVHPEPGSNSPLYIFVKSPHSFNSLRLLTQFFKKNKIENNKTSRRIISNNKLKNQTTLCLSFLAGAKVGRLLLLTKLFTTFFQKKIFDALKKLNNQTSKNHFPHLRTAKVRPKMKLRNTEGTFFKKNLSVLINSSFCCNNR